MEFENCRPRGGSQVKRAFFTRLVIGAAFAFGSVAPVALAQASIDHVGNFETADLSQWPGSGGLPNLHFLCCTHSAKIITSNPAPRAGRYAFGLERRANDPLIDGKWNRAELSLAGHMKEKLYSERWLGMSIYVPTGFPFESFSNGHHTVMQFHGNPRGSTALALSLLSGNRWQIGYRTLWPEQPVQGTIPPKHIVYNQNNSVAEGKWTDFVFHIVWDPRPSGNGLLEVWKDGEQIVDYRGPIGYTYSPDVAYFKLGSYASAKLHVTRKLYFDEVRFGNSSSSYADVEPARYASSGGSSPLPPPALPPDPIAPPPPGSDPSPPPSVIPEPPRGLVIEP